MDDGWNGFTSSFPSDDVLVKMTAGEMAEHAGLETEDFQDVINVAISRWRVNPAGSLINIIKDVEQGSAGQPMFADIKLQSQVIGAAILARVVNEREMVGVWGGEFKENGISRKPWVLTGDYCAMTAMGAQAAKINALGRSFRLWEERNRALVREGVVKLPKRLYRGIRWRDIQIDRKETGEDMDQWDRQIVMHQLIKEKMTQETLADFSRSELISFTSSKSIAEFFANREGYVVHVDPNDVSVVSAWNIDERLGGKDQLTGREEREWILRVGNYKLRPENIATHRKEVSWITRDPRGVAMMENEFVRAEYEINGKRIMCRPFWNATGTKTTLYFHHVGGRYPNAFKRAEFKKLLGFDPLPSVKDEVHDLQFYKTSSSYFSRDDKLIPHVDEDDFDLRLQDISSLKL